MRGKVGRDQIDPVRPKTADRGAEQGQMPEMRGIKASSIDQYFHFSHRNGLRHRPIDIIEKLIE